MRNDALMHRDCLKGVAFRPTAVFLCMTVYNYSPISCKKTRVEYNRLKCIIYPLNKHNRGLIFGQYDSMLAHSGVQVTLFNYKLNCPKSSLK